MEPLTLRQSFEKREHETLSPYASFSDSSRGRFVEESPCDIRPIYQRDRDRILHCKSFRRLKHKTQVFLAPAGDHYRTRLTHTLEVAQIARTVAKALRLNEELTEAIALGHDLGHTPFGHAGERALNMVCQCGFSHHEQSLRIVEKLEKDGEGMNLTWEVRDGILNHQTSRMPATLEGKIVRICDKVAYINHDIDDAIRGKIMVEEEIPMEFRRILGFSLKERLNTIIHDIVRNSSGKNAIIMSEEVEQAVFALRRFMFERVYTNKKAKGEESRAENMIIELYEYYLDNTKELPEEYIRMLCEGKEPKERIVCDYIAGMTDRYAIDMFREVKIPHIWLEK